MTETIDKLYLELSLITTAKTAREMLLEDLLISAHAIALRRGEGTAWRRFAAQLKANGIGSVTPKTFRILGDDDPENLPQNAKVCQPEGGKKL